MLLRGSTCCHFEGKRNAFLKLHHKTAKKILFWSGVFGLIYLLYLGNHLIYFFFSMFIWMGIVIGGREILSSVSGESTSMYLYRTAFVR